MAPALVLLGATVTVAAQTRYLVDEPGVWKPWKPFQAITSARTERAASPAEVKAFEAIGAPVADRPSDIPKLLAEQLKPFANSRRRARRLSVRRVRGGRVARNDPDRTDLVTQSPAPRA